MKKPKGPIPYTPSQKRRVLAQARRDGTLTWERLDRLLVRALATRPLTLGLMRSLKGVSFVQGEGGDEILSHTLDLSELAGQPGSDFQNYAEKVRSLPRMTREQEHTLARRLEFARFRLEHHLAGLNLPEESLEALMRGVNCTALNDAIRSVKPSNGKSLVSMPCMEIGSPMQSACVDYNLLRGHYVERNLYLVVGMSAAYRTYGIPPMDLIQEGNASLIRAVEKFDWRKDVRFGTYAAFWVRQAIERLITANRGMVRVPNYIQQKMRRLRREGKLPRNQRDMDLRDVSRLFDASPRDAARLMETDRPSFSLDAKLNDEETSFASMLAAVEEDVGMSPSERMALGKRLEHVMGETLTEQEREIIARRFGLGGTSPETLDQIGARMSVSRERIRQMQVKALDKLQKPRLLEELKDFL
jgi:RNA polymerase sigma factor (sigma-70 family)